MEDIPENLECLKRPALQQLCKKLGFKANGKNSAMISALKQYKLAREREEIMDEVESEPKLVSESTKSELKDEVESKSEVVLESIKSEPSESESIQSEPSKSESNESEPMDSESREIESMESQSNHSKSNKFKSKLSESESRMECSDHVTPSSSSEVWLTPPTSPPPPKVVKPKKQRRGRKREKKTPHSPTHPHLAVIPPPPKNTSTVVKCPINEESCSSSTDSAGSKKHFQKRKHLAVPPPLVISKKGRPDSPESKSDVSTPHSCSDVPILDNTPPFKERFGKKRRRDAITPPEDEVEEEEIFYEVPHSAKRFKLDDEGAKDPCASSASSQTGLKVSGESSDGMVKEPSFTSSSSSSYASGKSSDSSNKSGGDSSESATPDKIDVVEVKLKSALKTPPPSSPPNSPGGSSSAQKRLTFVLEPDYSGVEDVPRRSPSTRRRSPKRRTTRKRKGSFRKQSCEVAMETNSSNDLTPIEAPPPSKKQRVDAQDEGIAPPSTEKSERRSTYEVPLNESSLVGTPSVSHTHKVPVGYSPKNSTSEVPSLESGMLSSQEGIKSERDYSPLRGERRATYEVPLDESLSGVKEEAGSATISDGSATISESDSDAKDEILKLLEQRVQERQADPSYKAVHIQSTSTTTATSRIPIKSATQKKFEKAHKKNFHKMKSIADSYEAQGSCKKPQRKRSLSSLARASIRNADRRRATVGKGSASSASSFKPTSTLVKDFNFSKSKSVSFQSSTLKPKNTSEVVSSRVKTPAKKKQTRQSTSTSSSLPAINTPAKPFVFTAENSTKKANNKKGFDLQASLKRAKPKYKTYTGRVPKFNSAAL